MKKALIISGVVVLAVILLLLIIPYLVNLNKYKAQFLPKVETALGRKVAVGDIRLTLITGVGLELNDLSIGNHPEFRQEPFFSLKRLKVRVKVLPLLRKKVEIVNISLIQPSVLFEKDASGRFNFSDIGKKQEAEKKLPPSTTKEMSPFVKNLLISHIRLENGSLRYLQAKTDGTLSEIKVSGLKLNLEDVSFTEKIKLELSGTLDQAVPLPFLLQGTIGPLTTAPKAQQIPIELTAKIDKLDLASLKPWLGKGPAPSGQGRFEARLNGTLAAGMNLALVLDWQELKLPGKTPDAAPKLQARGPLKFTAALKITPPAQYDFQTLTDLSAAQIQAANAFKKDANQPFKLTLAGLFKENNLSLRELSLILGEVSIKGQGEIKNVKAPEIDFTFAAPPTHIASLAAMLPPLKKYRVGGNLSLNAQAQGKPPALKKLEGVYAAVALSDVSLVTEKPPKVDKLNALIVLKGGEIKVQDAVVVLGPNTIGINAGVRNFSHPQIDLRVASGNLNIDALLPLPANAKKAETAKTPAAPSKSGKPPAISLQAEVKVNAGKYKNFTFKNFVTHFAYADAAAELRDLSVEMFQGKISARGKVGLKNPQEPDWNLALSTQKIALDPLFTTFSSSAQGALYGNFSSDLAIAGRGKKWEVISKTAAGQGRVAIQNGKLSTVNILDAVGKKLVGVSALGGLAATICPASMQKYQETSFRDLSASADIRQGKLQVKDLKMQSSGYSLVAGGEIGLDQSLNLDTTLVMSKDASRSLQKDQILRNLLNSKGELEIPFKLSGTVRKPQVSPDSKALSAKLEKAAKKAVQDAVQKKIEKELPVKGVDKMFKGLFR